MNGEICLSHDELRTFVLNKMAEYSMFPAPNYQNLIIDGQMHRYQIEGRKKKDDGAYKIHDDNIPAGYIKDWHTGTEYTFKIQGDGLKAEKMPSDFDYKKWEEERKKRELEQLKKYAKAANDAYEYFNTKCEQYDFEHPYLTKKQLKNHYSIRIDRLKNYLVVPLWDINKNFISLQTISPEGDKRFFAGAKTKGVFFPIGLKDLSSPNTPIFLGEGVATMATVYELLEAKYPAIAAMNCGNLEEVARALKSRYPNNPIIITADNDLKTEIKTSKNPGIEAAQNVVNAKLALGYAAPPFDKNAPEGSDWNDYATLFGVKKARETLLEGKTGIKQFFMTKEQREDYFNSIELELLLDDLDPTIQLPPQEFVGGIFPCGYISSIVAPSGTGKTNFMQKFISDLSIGGTIFNGLAEDEPPRKCLIFAAEAGYELLVRRGASFKWHINSKNVKVADQYKFECKGKSLMLDDTQGLKNVIAIIEKEKPKIVFFDTFGSFHEADENKSVEIKPIIRALTDIARRFYIAIVLNHHSRKRAAKDRTLELNQDDVIGSSIFNRLVALIIGIEPLSDDDDEEKVLKVRRLKSWFRGFKPFTYKITRDLYGHSMVETNLSTQDSYGSRDAVWNYIQNNFDIGEWFSASQIDSNEIDFDEKISERLLRKIITELVNTGKLKKKGSTKDVQYSFGSYSS